MKQTVIPAIRHMKDFESALTKPFTFIILLNCPLSNLHRVVKYAQDQGKKILIHADLIDGLKSDEYAIEYLAQNVKPAGVISTRRNVILASKKNGLVAIQRLFLIDSQALETGIENARSTKPDYIELLPGIAFTVFREVAAKTNIPVIAGGLIKRKADIKSALDSGAVSVTVSDKTLWEWDKG